MSLKTQHLYDFGRFRLDVDEMAFLCDGTPVSITPKSIHLLKLLVENHGRILAKDWLMSEIWADSFVEDGNLSFNIRMLRKALDDNASNPTFIETIPRRGYRFIAEVSSPSTLETDELSTIVKEKPAVTSKFRLPLLATASFGLVVIAVIGLFAYGKLSNLYSIPLLSKQFTTEKFTSSGNVEVAAISRDGEYAAYVDEIAGKQSVWLRRFETQESVQILPPSDDFYFGLAFSQDGKYLYLVRKPTVGHTLPSLYRVSPSGGVPAKLADAVIGRIGVAPGNDLLSFVRCNYKPSDFCSLYVIDPDGGNERKIVGRQSPTHIKDNGFSPDGKSIAFAYGNSDKGSSDMRLGIVDIVSGDERQPTSRTFFDIKGLDWIYNGDEIIFSAKEYLDGKSSLWKLSVSNGECTKLADDPNSYFEVSIDRGGGKMVSTQVSNNYRLYLTNATGERSLTSAREFTFGPNNKIIYASDDRNIWEINADGSGQRQLTTDPATDFSPRVSPDGKIFFTSNRSGENHIWIMDPDGTNQTRVTKSRGGYPRVVTPDGKWVYYLAGHNERLWKVSTATGEESEVFEKKLYSPSVSPNGQYAAYFFSDGVFKIGIMNLANGELVKTIVPGDGGSFRFTTAWSIDSGTLFFIDKRNEKNILLCQAINSNESRPVAELGIDGIEVLETIPDGSGFAFTRGRWTHDAVLITGLN